MAKLRIRVDFEGGESLGPGKIGLLEAVREAGSIRGAAKRVGMSFRRAWLLLQAVEVLFGEALTETARGGVKGGGTALTPFGEFVVQAYRDLERAVERVAQSKMEPLAERVHKGRASRPLHTAPGARRKSLKR